MTENTNLLSTFISNLMAGIPTNNYSTDNIDYFYGCVDILNSMRFDFFPEHSYANLNSNESYRPLNPAIYNKKDKKSYYNQNKFISTSTQKESSDTYGDLKGSIYFAQNSIIPAVNRIEGDRQPTLVPNRKTLIMFKPQHNIPNNEDIYIEITDSKRTGSYIKKLSPPIKTPPVILFKHL
ncbi:hypothetical protein NFC79_05585 [Providencia stuartii]|nr:hypothetical protein NFC79_05585 [Providencia stuartii]